MFARRLPAWLLGCSALLVAAPLAAATLLKDVALSASGTDGARLVLDLSSAPAGAKVFRLSRPERLVIDLPRTNRAPGIKLPAAVGPVRTVRDGQNAGTLRLVFELGQAIGFRSRTEGRKLVVELGAASQPAPAPVTAAPAPASSASAVQAPAPPAPPKPIRPANAPADAARDIVVAIDAGHGGSQPGAVGPAGTLEKNVTLAIARALAKLVDAEPGMRAVLTRNDDRKLGLPDRVAIARRAKADLFVSIHADANKKSNITGSTVWVLSRDGASSEMGKWLADEENKQEMLAGGLGSGQDDAVASVLMDLSQTERIRTSAEAAGFVLGQLDRVGTIRKTEVQSAGFAVLKSRDLPSLLVETAFISNPGEEKKLRSPTHQQAVADAIFRGLRDYFRQSPPDGTLFARQRDEQRLVAASSPGSP